MFYSKRSSKLMGQYFWKSSLGNLYDDQYSSFTELLRIKDDSIVHQQNVEILMKEGYKFVIDLSPPLASDSSQVFEIVGNLRKFKQLDNTKPNR